jgi:hypothetical protein
MFSIVPVWRNGEDQDVQFADTLTLLPSLFPTHDLRIAQMERGNKQNLYVPSAPHMQISGSVSSAAISAAVVMTQLMPTHTTKPQATVMPWIYHLNTFGIMQAMGTCIA